MSLAWCQWGVLKNMFFATPHHSVLTHLPSRQYQFRRVGQVHVVTLPPQIVYQKFVPLSYILYLQSRFGATETSFGADG
jgi:hypothetical protein